MQIEVGKYYRTAEGHKVGPMQAWGHSRFHVNEAPGLSETWREDGSCLDEGSERFWIVSEWTDATPAEPEIEWGEWGPSKKDHAPPFQMQCFSPGVAQYRYPVQKQPVVETVTLYGCANGRAWSLKRYDTDTISISYDRIDGKPDWSTLRGEDLA